MNPFRKLLALAFNHAADRCLSIGLATNVSSILGNEEWQPLAEYGETEYWREEDGQWKKYKQVLARPQAEKMVAAINGLKVKQGAHFRGLPIYRGHPDADPKQWPDDARYGGVTDLEARADGLYAKLAWNDLGQRNREQGYYIYPSPAWLFDEADAKSRGIIAPDVLQSVGLTNTPRIKSSRPWTNQDPVLEGGASQFAANNPVGGNDPTQNQPPAKAGTPNNKMKKLLTQLLGMPEDAKDEEIEARHAEVMRKAPTNILEAQKAMARNSEELSAAVEAAKKKDADLEAQKTLATNAQAEAAKFRTLATNSALDRAIDAGRITAAERTAFETKFAADFDGALAELNAKKIALNTRALDPLKPVIGLDLSTPHGRSLAFNARLDELTRPTKDGGKGLSIDAAISAMRGNAEDAALLRSMEPAAAK